MPQTMPLSRGAQIANVIGEFYNALRRKELEKKQRGEQLQNLELQYGYQQRAAGEELERRKGLEKFKAELPPSELEQAQAEYWRSRTGEDLRTMEGRLAEQLGKNEFLQEQARLNRILFEIEKANLVKRFEGRGVPNPGDGSDPDAMKEYNALVTSLMKQSNHLNALMETLKRRDDETSKQQYMQAQKDLVTVEERRSYLQRKDPHAYLWAMMEAEKEMEKANQPKKEEKPGFMSKAWQFVKKLPGEAKEMVEREAPEKPKAPENVPPEPVAGKMSRFNMYYMDNSMFDEKNMDYLKWYVMAHPDDSKAMRKWQKLQSDPSMEWYFSQYRGTGGGY